MTKRTLAPEKLEAQLKQMVDDTRRILDRPPSEDGTGVYVSVTGPDGNPMTVEVPEECMESQEKLVAFIEACQGPKTQA